jgi:L-asparagine transporter-like permease
MTTHSVHVNVPLLFIAAAQAVIALVAAILAAANAKAFRYLAPVAGTVALMTWFVVIVAVSH